MRSLSKALTLILLIFFLFTHQSTAAINSFKIRSDNRPLIIFEKFGFTATGFLSIVISNVSVTSTGSPYDPSRIGFFLVWDLTPNQLRLELQQTPGGLCVENSILMFDSPLFTFREITDTYSSLHKSYHVTYPDQYSFFILNCDPESFVTMDVRIEAYNIHDGTTKDYLSVGLAQLPSLYFIISLIYINFLAIWIRVCFKNQQSVHRIHLLMGVLLTMQAVSMFCDGKDRHDVKVTGTPQGWDVMFYVFRFIKNLLFFTVIVLIGSGWSYLKQLLQKKEKMFLMIMIPIQVSGNVASIVIDETGPFNKYRVAWNQAYMWSDVVCRCAVLFPIVWSIRSLKVASMTDERAGRNLGLFRRFYRLYVCYVLFTRIYVIALSTTVGYGYQWVSSAGEETGTFVFYLVMFYMFSPFSLYQINRR